MSGYLPEVFKIVHFRDFNREDWTLAFGAMISGIVWVISVSCNWLTVTLETRGPIITQVVTQTIPEIKSLNASAQSSRSFRSRQLESISIPAGYSQPKKFINNICAIK